MSRIAIVKVRTAHDLEWAPSPTTRSLLRTLGASALLEHLEGTAGQAFMPLLTLPYLAALGERYNQATGAQHRFTLIDRPETEIDLAGYDMVWLTVSTPTAYATYRVADRVRASGVPVVIGGIHAGILPGEVAVHADVLVTGEAEDALPALLADHDAGRPLALRYTGRRRRSLDSLPVPRWEDAEATDSSPWRVPVQTSRGCRNACHFCAATRFQGAARRHRPVGDVIAELRELQDRGLLSGGKTVFFTDSNLVSDPDHRQGLADTRHARELFRALIPLGITWVGQGELAVGEDPELVDLMAESGCHQLLVSLESVNPHSLRSVGRRRDAVERQGPCIDVLHRHGVALIGSFVLGLDDDTPGTFEPTARFIERYVDIPQVSLLTPFPGTPLHARMKREGRLLHEDWSQYDLTHVVFRPRRMTPQELEGGYRYVTDRIYTPTAIASRALRHALRPTPAGHPQRRSRWDRITAIVAPNLMYRRLGRLGRGIPRDALAAERPDLAWVEDPRSCEMAEG
jgi:radical SAM superfamily enzyme YgiQ (UPF0313 family)